MSSEEILLFFSTFYLEARISEIIRLRVKVGPYEIYDSNIFNGQ